MSDWYRVEDPLKHEANCLANQLLRCAEDLVTHPTAATIRRISDELNGWASERADRAERGALIEGEETTYDPRKARAEIILRILEVVQ